MRRVLVLTIAMAVTLALAAPASAGGKGNGPVQLSAVGTFAENGCGLNSDFDILITGADEGWSLNGCLGQTIGEGYPVITPAGNNFMVRERGTEVFDGCLWLDGMEQGCGTFDTTYLFTGKFDGDFNEIFGRCQHPIVKGEGEGVFEGSTGRLDFKDDVDTGEFIMRGHIKVPNLS